MKVFTTISCLLLLMHASPKPLWMCQFIPTYKGTVNNFSARCCRPTSPAKILVSFISLSVRSEYMDFQYKVFPNVRSIIIITLIGMRLPRNGDIVKETMKTDNHNLDAS